MFIYVYISLNALTLLFSPLLISWPPAWAMMFALLAIYLWQYLHLSYNQSFWKASADLNMNLGVHQKFQSFIPREGVANPEDVLLLSWDEGGQEQRCKEENSHHDLLCGHIIRLERVHPRTEVHIHPSIHLCGHILCIKLRHRQNTQMKNIGELSSHRDLLCEHILHKIEA